MLVRVISFNFFFTSKYFLSLDPKQLFFGNRSSVSGNSLFQSNPAIDAFGLKSKSQFSLQEVGLKS